MSLCRRMSFALIAAGALSLGNTAAFASDADTALGQPLQFLPDTPPTGTVVIFSDAGGWGQVERGVAQALTKQGFAVVGVDLPRSMQRIRARQSGCSILIGEVEAISHALQRKTGARAYHFPVLAGVGEGGTMALAVATQAAAATLSGVVAVDPLPAPAVREALCGNDGRPVSDANALLMPPPLPFTVELLASAQSGSSARKLIARLAMGRADLQASESAESPAAALLAGVGRAGQPSQDDALGELPLIELPAQDLATGTFAVFYSGDGGWRDLDKDVAALLQREGLPVVGLDVLRYFWSLRSPEQGARDLARIIDTYARRWKASRVVLIGYSFGADVLPAIYNRLPAETKGRVIQISLLGFSTGANFEVTVSGWLGQKHAGTLPTLPEALRIDQHLLQCFIGEEDDNAGCEGLGSGAEIIRTRGGHHFDGDYDALARRILLGARQRASN